MQVISEINSTKEQELATLRASLAKEKAQGKKWTMATNFMIVILVGLLVLHGAIVYQSYK